MNRRKFCQLIAATAFGGSVASAAGAQSATTSAFTPRFSCRVNFRSTFIRPVKRSGDRKALSRRGVDRVFPRLDDTNGFTVLWER